MYHSPLPPGSGCKLSPCSQGGGIEDFPLPPGRRSELQGRDQGERAGGGNHIPPPDPSPWPREGSRSLPLAQGMRFRPSPWGRERDLDTPPGQGEGFTILPCPQGVDVNLLPAPREEELKTSPCPQGVGFGGRERVQGIQGGSKRARRDRRANSAAPKDILSSDLEIHPPAQGEGIRGKGGRSELHPLGQGEGVRHSPWARGRDQGEQANKLDKLTS